MQQNESPGKKFALGFVHLRLQTEIDISGCSYLYPTLNPLPLTVSRPLVSSFCLRGSFHWHPDTTNSPYKPLLAWTTERPDTVFWGSRNIWSRNSPDEFTGVSPAQSITQSHRDTHFPLLAHPTLNLTTPRIQDKCKRFQQIITPGP